MKIVIDIPKEDYDIVKKQVADGITNPLKICIAKGTPLPKGHGDLIDADRKITVPIYYEQHKKLIEETLTVREALNEWSNGGIDIVISADKSESEVGE